MINFQEVVDLFPKDDWDVGLLMGENYYECINFPIKLATHSYGVDITNPITAVPKSYETFEEINSFVILIGKTEKSNDYSLYEESKKILEKKFICDPVYLNFKKAAVLSGLGSIAKNSLLFNRKFGFQCKICAYNIGSGQYYNYEIPEINRNILDLCDGCNDCIVNCPAGAIHETWVDSRKCDTYIGLSNSDKHTSIKWFWWEKCGKYQGKYTEQDLKNWSTFEDFDIKWESPFTNKDGILKKNGIVMDIPHCRECQKQPKCSKMPYIITQ
jgi:ferredoxin